MPRLLAVARRAEDGERRGRAGVQRAQHSEHGVPLFPAVARYSTDLHSFGQYVQEGQRTLIETFLMPKNDDGNLVVPSQKANLDGLNYLAGKPYTEINRKVFYE